MTVISEAYNPPPARDPEASVFVAANAGSGKTSLLVERVLSLLLYGAAPGKILCLTYTNAAAAEMRTRVQTQLGAWVMAEETELQKSVSALLGKAPDTAMMRRARSLFATVLEAPDGIRIQTIHGFCQSLLKRFPLEAGVSPHFEVADARTSEALLQEARQRLFLRAQTEDKRLQKALSAVARALSETSFHALLTEMISQKRRFSALLSTPQAVEETIARISEALGVQPGATLDTLVEQHFAYDKDTLAQLLRLPAMLLAGSGQSDQKTGKGLADWLEFFPPSAARADAYVEVFVTQKCTPRKSLFTQKTLKDAALIEALLAEQQRVLAFCQARRALDTARQATHMLHIAEALLALYDAQKRQHGLMDYDDLILTASRLLEKPGIAPWVLYKLDGGIDHVLVDEAQDTSPEQWHIIDALTQEFFAGAGRSDAARTLFVVGDEKQSIFSFQGADAAGLSRWQAYFAQRISEAAQPVHRVALTKSYRSTPEILTAVDAVFAHSSARAGLTFEETEFSHIPTRLSHAGVVELWPLIEAEEVGEATTRLVRHLADTIAGWLQSGVMLEAKGRAVQPGDIMILVRRRAQLAGRLVRALKRRGVPVAGQDRMVLGDNLAVQDLVALGQIMLLPEDDLTLAALLKSPIFDISEALLFELAYGRKESLWERLRAHEAPQCKQAFALLSDLRARADFVAPYELYSYLLDTQGARRRFTGRMGGEYHDPIDEFLGQALLYERSHPPSLQGFLHWLAASDSEIKRDMEQAQDAVRILTVHGAKGLQAPIVILPDTVSMPRGDGRLLWQENDAGWLPLWALSSDDDDILSAALRDGQKQAAQAEYRRLMYVALTRAEDRLYVCGAKGKTALPEGCWYDLIQKGLEAKGAKFEMPWGDGVRMGSSPREARRGASLASTELECPHPNPPPMGEGIDFTFLTRPAPDEPVPPRPLAPSRLAGDEPAAASPLTEQVVYQRGNLIHRLLQYLPDIVPEKRAAVAWRIAGGVDTALRDECIAEALKIINDEQFAFCFAPGSLAEVPVAGSIEMGGKTVAVAGQIDRLAVKEDEVWIIDYKSNRTPPAAVPPTYLGQLRLYQLLLEQIYPGKTVRCALLWTAAPAIALIAQAQLDEVPASAYI